MFLKQKRDKSIKEQIVAGGKNQRGTIDKEDDALHDHVVFYFMTQISMKAGMRQWGEPSTETVSTEFEQLHYRDTFNPVNHRSLSKKEYEKVLESHMFLKQNCDESIKGRMVARGNKQRGTIDKEDAASPTAALKSVLLTFTIDAAE